jgi:beta-1,4-N-acetylglucosaminyltransferase
MFRKNNLLCVVCSAGGHLTEALLATQDVDYPKYFVTYWLPHMSKTLSGEQHYFITNPHKNPFKYVVNLFQSLIVYFKHKPKFILSTGSGMAIATCFLGKLFGSKVIYVETGARVTSPSMTGKLMYRFSDLFIVQWEPLMKHFPSAVYGGPLI